MIKVGSEVIILAPFWHQGDNLGECLGRVISTESYIMVEVYDYNNNPIKCFRNDIEVLQNRDLADDDEIDFKNLFGLT